MSTENTPAPDLAAVRAELGRTGPPGSTVTGPEPQSPQEVRRSPDGRVAVLMQLGRNAEWKWIEIGTVNGHVTVWARDEETVTQWKELE